MPATPEAMMTCPLCRDNVAASAFDEHLRRQHDLVTYRSVRRSSRETLEAVLGDLLTARPAPEAWQALWQLARDAQGATAEKAVAEWLGEALAQMSQRNDAVTAVTAALAPLATHPRLIAALTAQPRPAARALALTSHLHLTPDGDLARSLRPLLRDRQLSTSGQIDVLATLLPKLEAKAAGDLIDALVAGVSRAQALRVLRALEKRSKEHPLAVARREELQQTAKLVCPRCQADLPREAMEQHLWAEHRLVLDGLKTRDPWAIIDEWLDACRDGNAPEWLPRCRIAAAKIDPEAGPLRVARMIQSRGLGDGESRQLLLSLAREKQASCCPWCFGLVPVPTEEEPPYVNLRRGRLSARGYEVRTNYRGIRPRLEVRVRDRVIYEGVEPGKAFTARGVSLLVVGPLVLLALLFAALWPRSGYGSPFEATILTLGLALAAFVALRFYGRMKAPSTVPLVEYAWKRLVPRLHGAGFTPADAAFAAGLARLHERVGVAGVDAEQVGRLMRLTESAAAKGSVPPGHLAALCRLWIGLEAQKGRDPIPLVVGLVAKAFEGRLPFRFAQRLLEEWSAIWWTPTNLARLRVLLCDRAFEAGYEVQNLLDAGQNAPALGTVLGTSDPRSLAALRLLWSLRATRPWDKLGDVKTAFELAANPDQAAALSERGELLLYLRDPSWLVAAEGEGKPTPATMRLSTVGVYLQGVLFRIPPRVVDVRMRASGCTLTMGQDSFRSPEDLEPLSRVMEKWFRYGFHEFLPGVDRAATWQSPDRAAILRAWGAVPCPDCGRQLLPRVGEVGTAHGADKKGERAEA